MLPTPSLRCFRIPKNKPKTIIAQQPRATGKAMIKLSVLGSLVGSGAGSPEVVSMIEGPVRGVAAPDDDFET